MPKFLLYFTKSVGDSLVVEAEDEYDALQQADDWIAKQDDPDRWDCSDWEQLP